MTMQHSFTTWLDRHPGVKAAATLGAALGIGAMLAQGRSGGSVSQLSANGRVARSVRANGPEQASASIW
jgi:hypothetical protein